MRNWSRALSFWDERIDFSRVQDALEIGARSGGLSLWLALHGVPHIICSDCEDNTAKARPLHQQHGCETIEYQVIDANEISCKAQFDLICFKSVLGVVGSHNQKQAQQQTLARLYDALRPGGVLVFAENLKASRVHQHLRRRYVKWGANWRYVTLKELYEFTRPFAQVEIRSYGCFAALGRTETQRRWLGVADRLLCPLLPKRWHYIAFSICKKI